MKHKLLALLAVIGMVMAFAPPSAHAYTVDMSNVASWPSPYYGGENNTVALTAPGTGNNAFAYISSFADVTANYTSYPTTWRYPSPGIPYHWLETWSVPQYSDSVTAPANNGTENGDGSCTVSGGTSGHLANPAGDYTTHDNGGLTYMKDCYHPWVRIRVESSWNAGGLGWHTITNWSPWESNLNYACVHLHDSFKCTQTL